MKILTLVIKKVIFSKFLWKNFFKFIKYSFPDEFGEVSVDCPTDFYNLPVTFKNEKGYLKLEGSGKSFNFNVSFEFR